MSISNAPPILGQRTARPWLMLFVAVFAQASATVLVNSPAFLIPLLHTERGLSLVQAGLLASAPTLGMVLTLIAWGALTDRFGERWVIAAGLAAATLAALGAVLVPGYAALGTFLLIAGMASASPNAASGRIVVGWFPRERRGLAMGIRQMCQPLGVAVAAVSIPVIAESAGIGAALLLPVVLCGISAVLCAVCLVDPPRARPAESSAARAANPYRAHTLLWRIHLVSVLLVVPQYTLSIFGLLWLTSEWHYSTVVAGVVIGVAQLVGAVGRIFVGVLSDRVGSRLRPLLWVAISAVVVMLLMAATSLIGAWFAPIAYVVAAIIVVADNGLAYTSVAEIAGTTWSGRALGAQNTGQFIAASVVGPVIGAAIAAIGFPLAFLVVAACPVVSIPFIPRDRELPATSL